MSTKLDLSPLFRSGIGFDRMLNALETAGRGASIDNWPPYDIVKADDDHYRTRDDLAVTRERTMLVIAGRKPDGEEDGRYLHRGIAARAFQRRFELADHVKVVGASLVNGLLTIDLKREIPEEMKPRRIAIAAGGAPDVETGQIEPGKLAA